MSAIGNNKTPVTNSQIDQINQLVNDTIGHIVSELGLDATGADNVIEQGEEFADGIRKAVTTLLKELSLPYKFKEEEVESSDFDYGSGYRPIDREASFEEVLQDLYRQAEIISKLFGIKPLFDVEWAREKWKNLPDGAEKLFLIPQLEKIAPTYEQVCYKVSNLILQTRSGKFYSHSFEGKFGLDQLRQSARSVSFWNKLDAEQKGHDLLVVPAQFGLRHSGRSFRRACEVMDENECGLGVFAVGTMLLTHPERLQQESISRILRINCSDEYNDSNANDRFVHVMGFDLENTNWLRLVTHWRGQAMPYFGFASMFL